MPWLIPTRRRLPNLRRFFAAMKECETSTPGLLLVERGDLAEHRAEYDALEMPPGWQIIECVGDSQGEKIRETQHLWWDAEWIGLGGDDQVVMTKHWDRLYLSHLTGSNFVTCEDNWTRPKRVGMPHTPKGRIAGFICWSGPLLRAVGCMFAPGAHHTYLDDQWEEISSKADCWYMALEIVIDHVHYQAGRVAEDETYTKAYASGPVDVASWNIWRQTELDAAVQRIFALKDEIEEGRS